ncbi:hypothetical protein SAMN04490355_103215 [Pelosinus propionicus DSM 13327]|uniref:Uncharacterized protein n=1 Tax=Pelosinus propionicus DSM 13327 TaxID=1123291 RepID=A0A1I4MCT1_9FIRM|nr:hypothetical protein SAMN04490355_103215 [Pelosinus propionicus DSM 13327]
MTVRLGGGGVGCQGGRVSEIKAAPVLGEAERIGAAAQPGVGAIAGQGDMPEAAGAGIVAAVAGQVVAELFMVVAEAAVQAGAAAPRKRIGELVAGDGRPAGGT